VKPQGTGDPTPRRATAAARRVPSKPAVQATPQGGCHQNQRYRRPHLTAAPGPEEAQKAAWPLSRAGTRCNSLFARHRSELYDRILHDRVRLHLSLNRDYL